jgi:hypothetical protein
MSISRGVADQYHRIIITATETVNNSVRLALLAGSLILYRCVFLSSETWSSEYDRSEGTVQNTVR